jgi:hypothetical protein
MSDREAASDTPADGEASEERTSPGDAGAVGADARDNAGKGGADTDEDSDPDSAGGPRSNGTGEREAQSDEWAYTVEDIEDREREQAEAAAAEEAESEPIEAGDPSLEGTAFVLLGVLFTLFVFSRLVVG